MSAYNIKHFWIHRRIFGNVNPEVFFIAHSFQHQKGIGQGNQGNIVMPPCLARPSKYPAQPFPSFLRNPVHCERVLLPFGATLCKKSSGEANFKASTSRVLCPPPAIQSAILPTAILWSCLALIHSPSKQPHEQNEKRGALLPLLAS